MLDIDRICKESYFFIKNTTNNKTVLTKLSIHDIIGCKIKQNKEK